jgi:hypothetical protein
MPELKTVQKHKNFNVSGKYNNNPAKKFPDFQRLEHYLFVKV